MGKYLVTTVSKISSLFKTPYTITLIFKVSNWGDNVTRSEACEILGIVENSSIAMAKAAFEILQQEAATEVQKKVLEMAFDVFQGTLKEANEPNTSAPQEEPPLPDSAFENLSNITASHIYEAYEATAFFGLLKYEKGPWGENWEVVPAPNRRSFLLASASWCYVWDVARGKITNQWGAHAISDTFGCDISEDGSQALTANASGEVFLWSYPSGRVLRRLEGHQECARKVKFIHGTNNAFSIGWDGNMFLWDLSTGNKKQIGSTRGSHFDKARHANLVVSHSGKNAYVVDAEDNITCIDLSKAAIDWRQKILRVGDSFMGLAVAPNEHVAAISRKSTLVWYDIQNQQVLQKYENCYKPFHPGPAAAFSPDGQLCATGSNKDIIIWRMPSRRPVMRLTGHQSVIYSICFLGDSKTILSTGNDRTVCLWRI